EPRHGVSVDFGVNPYIIAGQPLSVGQEADGDVIERAARAGYLTWTFVPMALACALMRRQWAHKDRTIDPATCRRDARKLDPQRLYGPMRVPGTAHDHIYQFGRGAHGNRSRAGRERRG
ncbi:MAG: hypothetical protein JNL68_04385, partial [Burkholderiales bacterium]|nr:hypothetical protein [Burkholderiales bacterium]